MPQIFIKDFAKKTHVVDLMEETVDELIARFLVQCGMDAVPIEDLRLLQNGRLMVGSEPVSTYKLEMHATLMLIKLERGGAPRPWSEQKPKPATLGLF
jgi:hypothetical protein